MSHGPAEWEVRETLIARLRREAEVRGGELAKLRERLGAAEHELEDLRAIRDALTPPELPGRAGLELAAAPGIAITVLRARVADFAYGTLTDDLCALAARIH